MTFQDCWNMVVAHADVPDPLLARSWVQWAYNQFCDRRAWSDKRTETVIVANDQKSGTCTVTRNSDTVAGGTLVFAATDVGRQFRISSIPIYTIIAVDTTGGTAATLERAYSEVTQAAVVATVLDAYVTMPLNFHRFISILDPNNKWRLRFWVTQDTLNAWDPGRTSSGNARLLASQAYSPVPGMTGQARYELYPYQTSFRTYPVWYYRKPENLRDTDVLLGPLATRGQEILLEGALSRAAMWPGTTGRKNPYFNLELAKTHRDLFEDKLREVTVIDDELYFESMPLTSFPYCDFPWDWRGCNRTNRLS